MSRTDGPLDQLIRQMASLPGLGPRSARRVALHLIHRKAEVMLPLAKLLEHTAESVKTCESCYNLDTVSPCRICQSATRDRQSLCIVATVADLWAIERTGAFKGLYYVLGGVLSALDGITPEDLNMSGLRGRVTQLEPQEIILAMSATVDAQATVHVLIDLLNGIDVKISRLAHGVPVGGELDYLDEGTIVTALKSRSAF